MVNAIEGLTPSIAFRAGDRSEDLHPYARLYRLLRNPVLRVSLTVVVSTVRDEVPPVEFLSRLALAVLSTRVIRAEGGNRPSIDVHLTGAVSLVRLVNVDPTQGPELLYVNDGLGVPALEG